MPRLTLEVGRRLERQSLFCTLATATCSLIPAPLMKMSSIEPTLSASIREKDYRGEFAAAYYDMALGIGHSQVTLSDGRKNYHGLVELQGSLGVVFWDAFSVGVGATIRTLGYPGETAAFSASPYVAAGIWFF